MIPLYVLLEEEVRAKLEALRVGRTLKATVVALIEDAHNKSGRDRNPDPIRKERGG